MMCAFRVGRDSDMGAALPTLHVPQTPEGPFEFGAADIAAASRHQDLIPYKVKANQPRPVHGLVEVAVDGFKDTAADIFNTVPLGVDAVSKRAR